MDRSLLGRLVLVLASSTGVFLFFSPLPASARYTALSLAGAAGVAGALLARSGDRARSETSRRALESIDRMRRDRKPR